MAKGKTKNADVEAEERTKAARRKPRAYTGRPPAEDAPTAREPAEYPCRDERKLPVPTKRRLWKQDALLAEKGI